MTLAEFLDWEERQELRYEFDGFQPIAMTGGTAAARNDLRHAARPAVSAAARQSVPALGSEQQDRGAGPHSLSGRVRELHAGPPGRHDRPGPVVVFEVLSPSTSRTDRIEKLREYQATPSIQRYVILEQDSIAAMVFSRHGRRLDRAARSPRPTYCKCRRSASNWHWRNLRRCRIRSRRGHGGGFSRPLKLERRSRPGRAPGRPAPDSPARSAPCHVRPGYPARRSATPVR